MSFWESQQVFSIPLNEMLPYLLLLTALPLSWIIGKIIAWLIRKTGTYKWLRMRNMHLVLAGWDVADFVGKTVATVLFFVLLDYSLSILQLNILPLKLIISWIPKVLAAIFILAVGSVVARYIETLKTGIELPDQALSLLQALIVVVFVVAALAQVGFWVKPIEQAVYGVVLSLSLGIGGAVALALGLGLKDTVAEIAKKKRIKIESGLERPPKFSEVRKS